MNMDLNSMMPQDGNEEESVNKIVIKDGVVEMYGRKYLAVDSKVGSFLAKKDAKGLLWTDVLKINANYYIPEEKAKTYKDLADLYNKTDLKP